MTEALSKECAPGKVRRVFPGNNTAYGFYSFYDQIVGPGANHIFVIKGGPGVGKSTFMRVIGQALVDRGFDIEQHCCSSDPNSLDGVYIPAIDVALIDGTSPQSVVTNEEPSRTLSAAGNRPAKLPLAVRNRRLRGRFIPDSTSAPPWASC